MPFRIRIRESDKLFNGKTALKGKVVFAHLKPHQTQVLTHRHCLWGHWVYVVALKLEDGKLLIVATAHAPQTAIADYAHRWGAGHCGLDTGYINSNLSGPKNMGEEPKVSFTTDLTISDGLSLISTKGPMSSARCYFFCPVH